VFYLSNKPKNINVWPIDSNMSVSDNDKGANEAATNVTNEGDPWGTGNAHATNGDGNVADTWGSDAKTASTANGAGDPWSKQDADIANAVNNGCDAWANGGKDDSAWGTKNGAGAENGDGAVGDRACFNCGETG
jgi:hypothetical protein